MSDVETRSEHATSGGLPEAFVPYAQALSGQHEIQLQSGERDDWEMVGFRPTGVGTPVCVLPLGFISGFP